MIFNISVRYMFYRSLRSES